MSSRKNNIGSNELNEFINKHNMSYFGGSIDSEDLVHVFSAGVLMLLLLCVLYILFIKTEVCKIPKYIKPVVVYV